MLAPPKVVFLCRNNSARSQMAEAMLRQKAGETFDVYSAGSGTKPIKPTVIEVMEEAGFCLDGHYSKKVEQLAHLQPIDYAILVCPADEDCPRFDCFSGEMTCWGIESPFPGKSPSTLSRDEKLIHYRSLRDQLLVKMDQWLEEEVPRKCYGTSAA